jgi:uncharacterized membrane protein (DUF373 family)
VWTSGSSSGTIRFASPQGTDRERRDRSGIAVLLGYGEFLIDTVVALALIVGGTILLGVVVYDFVRDLGQGPFSVVVLELLSGLLLVFIFTELISTIRVVIARRRVVVEPFLIVGIVAAVRRLIVISAEAENLLGTAQFRDVMLEIAILAGTVLLLGATVLILRIKRAEDAEPTTGLPE